MIRSQFISLDQNHIEQIPIINTTNQDELMWMYELNGIYSVKSGYQAIRSWQIQQKHNTTPNCSSETTVWKKLWKLHTIPRHKVILWRILHNSLPVRSELNKRGIHCSILCPRCNSKMETITHTFMTCPNILRTWFGSSLTIKFPDQPNPNFVNWLFDFILHEDEQIIIQTAAIIYSIWFSRNLSIFENKTLPEEDIILRAEHSIQEYKAATKTDPGQADSMTRSSNASTTHNNSTACTTHNNSTKWRRPETGFVKANGDANLKYAGSWGIGAIIRDEEGLVMAAATWKVNGGEDTLMAEAHALISTMRLAKDCGFRRVYFESDNKRLISLIKEEQLKTEEKRNRSYTGQMIKEIWKLQLSFDKCNFMFTHRSGNKVADQLAHLAHEKPNMVWIEEVPIEANTLYFHDLLN